MLPSRISQQQSKSLQRLHNSPLLNSEPSEPRISNSCVVLPILRRILLGDKWPLKRGYHSAVCRLWHALAAA